MDVAFHKRLREGFLDIARREPDRCVVVAADEAVANVSAAVIGAVRAKLAPPGL
jgi:dTMP kinase